MAIKIAFIGAGSVGFTRGLSRDILSVPEFDDISISMMDINEHNLEMVYKLVARDALENGKEKVQINRTTDRREALANANYVINCARVGGLEAFETDIDIPLKYGVDQCVGDTLCAGGIMYGQRGIFMMLDLCRDIREVCKRDCLLLNYANPNAMMTWAANTFGNVKTLGLCHGVQGGHSDIAKAFGLEKEDVDIICAGINHQTWYISAKHNGEDLTGRLLEAFQKDEDFCKREKVRVDMLKRFGYYSTESNGHLSEYLSWYRKRPEEITKWIDMRTWILGETGGYLRVCNEGRNWFETEFPKWLEDEPKKYGSEHRGVEHGSYIIEGLETGRVYRGHFNLINNGCITNLPDDSVVEVPAYVDGNGISVPKVGDLPLGCAAVCNSSISVQRLAVYAAVKGDINLLRQAMLMDPLVGAVCNPPEVWQMTDEMLVAQKEWLPQYEEEIIKAEKRLADGPLLPTREYEGAARLKTRTVEEMAKEKEKADSLAGESDKGH